VAKKGKMMDLKIVPMKATVVFVVLFLCFASSAFAIPCTQGGVSGSVSCQDGTGNNDFLNPTLAVNSQSFFGQTDWEFLQKQGTPGALETDVDVGLVVSPTTGTQSGIWSFSGSAWSIYQEIMIVLKSANAFSGYLLDSVATPVSGTWDTGNQNLSHLSIYGRGSVDIPESATLFLVGGGLIMVAGFSRRRHIKMKK
jgi:hypothetical protein